MGRVKEGYYGMGRGEGAFQGGGWRSKECQSGARGPREERESGGVCSLWDRHWGLFCWGSDVGSWGVDVFSDTGVNSSLARQIKQLVPMMKKAKKDVQVGHPSSPSAHWLLKRSTISA